jgi:hypothetical protein
VLANIALDQTAGGRRERRWSARIVSRTQRNIMAKTKSTNEIVFKVALKGRRVWRTIALRGDHTLEQLHGEIFAAFNRFDDHLYSFYFPKAPRRRGPEIHPKEYVAPVSFDDSGPGNRRFNAASTSLDGLKLKVGQTFEYLFDYGDCWWHQVAVERIGPFEDGCRYPVLLEKHGQSPRQYGNAE